MTIKYRYVFCDNFVFEATTELPFNILKVAIDTHGGLRKIQKVACIDISAY